MSKLSNCEICSINFTVKSGCTGRYCSSKCFKLGRTIEYREKAAKDLVIKIEKYSLESKICKRCNIKLSYEKRMNSFCSRNCSSNL